MSDLVRPEPPPSWRARAAGLAQSHPGVAAGAAVLAVVGALVWFLLQPAVATGPSERPGGADRAAALPRATTTSTTTSVVVYVAGAVARPGLVSLPAGSRVAHAIAAAGGAVEGADLDRVNLAAPVADGTRLYVPFAGRPIPPDETATGPPGGGGAPAVVDLNTATAEELESLPGIGPATAQAIIEYRRQHGRFRSVDELLAVRGIGPAKLAQIKGRVRV